MMHLRYSPSAALDLEAIYATIAADNQPAAQRVVARVRHIIALLAEHPGMGLPSELADVYKLVVPGLPYKIVYEPDDIAGELVVLRVLHTSRSLPH